MKRVICLMGPTASGKTALASALIKKFPCEIISVDSALIYKYMDVGTAKPTTEELKDTPHRLINFLDPSENYSVGQFCVDVKREIEAVIAAGKIPLLVGGTMMYFNAIQQGIASLPESVPEHREAIDQEAAEKGWPAMHEALMNIDPIVAQRIHPHDQQRIQRALEVFRMTGKPMSELQQDQPAVLDDYDVLNIIIMPSNRQYLHERIVQRFQSMLDAGLIEEVKHLFERGDLHLNKPSMRTVGYRQVWHYLLGDYDYDTMVQKAIVATRQLAKRQITWLRQWRDQDAFFYDINEVVEIEEALHRWIREAL